MTKSVSQNATVVHRLSALTPLAFGTQRPSLDAVAAAVRRAQQEGTTPAIAGRHLVTTSEGEIVLGDPDGQGRRVGALGSETFAAFALPGERVDALAVSEERVKARPMRVDGRRGWAWDIVTEFGDRYSFFGYRDRDLGEFLTMLGSPRLERSAQTQHDLHLFRDGTMCLTPHVYCRDLAHAHSRSALWARGASCWRRGLGFTFNLGQ